MRCDNCGWMNPEGVENCQKCNQKLRLSPVEEPKKVNAPAPEPAPSAPAVVFCDKCGREYSLQMPSCPHCGFTNPKFQECSEPVAPAAPKNDMNKTVAFGAGMASSHQSAPITPSFAAQDKSDLKKTMVAGRTAPETPAAMPPFGVQDKSELKKTMVAGRETPEAPAAMPPFGVQDKSELKKTMVAGRETPEAPAAMPPFGVQDKSELKKTMVAGDFVAYQAPAQQPNLQHTVNDVAGSASGEELSYTLQSMDHGSAEPVEVKMTASADISLKKGDVILMAGMRYRVL